MQKNKIDIYGDYLFGQKISEYGLQHGYLDYRTLAYGVGNTVLNNNIINYDVCNWEQISGFIDDDDEYGMLDIYQWYIISDNGAKLLEELTDEIVYYNDELDMYLWGITHYGTSWDYVLTDVKLNKIK